MTEFLGLITTFMTAVLGWIPDVTAVIIADPLLVLPFVILVIGFIVGILGRILQLR